MVLVLYVCYAIPLRMGFDAPVEVLTFYFFVDTVADFCFMVDIVLNFLTGYYDYSGKLVHDAGEIKRSYLGYRDSDRTICAPEPRDDGAEPEPETYCRACCGRPFMCYPTVLNGWFIWDIVSVFPVSYIQLAIATPGEKSGVADKGKGVRILRLLRLAKLMRLGRMKRVMDRKIGSMSSMMGMLAVAKAMGIALVLSHLVACFWHYLGMPDDECSNPDNVPMSRGAENMCEATWFDGYVH